MSAPAKHASQMLAGTLRYSWCFPNTTAEEDGLRNKAGVLLLQIEVFSADTGLSGVITYAKLCSGQSMQVAGWRQVQAA